MRNVTNSGSTKFFQVEEIKTGAGNRDSALWDKCDSLALLKSEERGKGGRDEVLRVGKWEIIKSLSQKMTWLNKCM